jgi:hypothetical protein
MVEPWRIAQLAGDRGPDHDGSRGSGYLIAPGRVLTAAHVVAGASSVRVRLDVDQDTEIDVLADSWWADPRGHDGTDLAVVTFPADVTAGRECEPARFGRVSDDGTAVLMVQAFGFPLFKVRNDSGRIDQSRGFRDFEQAVGHTPVSANRRQGTLAVYLDDPPPSPPAAGDPSPWEGMSGGPVWASGRIVAVVAEHHASEGTGRLTARRIDRAYEQLSASDLGTLSELLGLAPAVSGLPDVVPAEQVSPVRSAYLAQVRDIAPDTLIGRENELADWAEFCAGTDPYAWWQGEAWAGKSALASWFVTHPPAGVDVVSFFTTGRLSGKSSSDAFLDAMIEQLDALDPAGERSLTLVGAQMGVWLNRLASAAAQAEERARRLVIVVDGLDEDEAGTTPPQGRPSIASLLPRRPPPGARFIIISRLGRDLPTDVPSGHPLRTCIPHRLPVSPVAQDLEERARQELQDLSTGDQIDVNGDVRDFSSHGIFLSYRREDAAPYARLLQFQLRERFPDVLVFMDLDSIEAGLDFVEVIEQALGSCAVVVALIGRQWATLADAEGHRRLDDPDDFVRFEVQTALERGVRVIPVLVDGARPLRRQELPAELHKLARLNALELSYGRYQYDADRLLDLIQRVLAAVGGPSETDR